MKNIFVGNLDYDTTEDDLRTMFEAHGPVEGVRIMTDRDTGRSRGFAFVEMTNDPDADRAIAELNGAALRGRALNVNEARPKPDRAGGGRFGGGAGAGGGGGFRKPGGGGGGAGGGRGRGRGPRW